MSFMSCLLSSRWHLCVLQGMQLEWSSFRLESYVRKFADVVFGFQERVDEAILHNEELEKEITQLSSCDYSKETYSEILERIQKIVDDLNLHSYSNLQKWVAELDTRVRAALIYLLYVCIPFVIISY